MILSYITESEQLCDFGQTNLIQQIKPFLLNKCNLISTERF